MNQEQVLTQASDAWMWSNHFLQMLSQAEEDIAQGRVRRFTNVDDLIDDLNA
jgi:hypothetical protein